jgi:hypothetical protein
VQLAGSSYGAQGAAGQRRYSRAHTSQQAAYTCAVFCQRAAPASSDPLGCCCLPGCVHAAVCLCGVYQQVLQMIPESSHVGLVTFGTHVHVHELGYAECSKAFVFRGSKEYNSSQVCAGPQAAAVQQAAEGCVCALCFVCAAAARSQPSNSPKANVLHFCGAL